VGGRKKSFRPLDLTPRVTYSLGMNDALMIVATATRTFSCGTVGRAEIHRERGSWYLWTPEYQERFTTKKAAFAALEAWKVF
jgi:hypothetical protein